MADGSNNLLLVVESANELQRLVVDTQKIWIDLPAGQHNCVVVVGAGLLEADIDRDRLAPILLFPTTDLPALGRHNVHRCPVFLEAIPRDLELRLLETVRG